MIALKACRRMDKKLLTFKICLLVSKQKATAVLPVASFATCDIFCVKGFA